MRPSHPSESALLTALSPFRQGPWISSTALLRLPASEHRAAQEMLSNAVERGQIPAFSSVTPSMQEALLQQTMSANEHSRPLDIVRAAVAAVLLLHYSRMSVREPIGATHAVAAIFRVSSVYPRSLAPLVAMYMIEYSSHARSKILKNATSVAAAGSLMIASGALLSPTEEPFETPIGFIDSTNCRMQNSYLEPSSLGLWMCAHAAALDSCSSWNQRYFDRVASLR